jgi:hypothetical protein
MKRYMAYSFATLWTLALIIALVATVIHQAKFQDSATELNLNHQVRILELQNQRLGDSLNQQAMEHAAYREWVNSWREAW